MKRLNPLLRRLRLTCGDLATRDGWQGILKLTIWLFIYHLEQPSGDLPIKKDDFPELSYYI